MALGSGCKLSSSLTLLVVGLDRASVEGTGALVDTQSTHRWLGHEVAQSAPQTSEWPPRSQLNVERCQDILCRSPDVRMLTPSTHPTPVPSHQPPSCLASVLGSECLSLPRKPSPWSGNQTQLPPLPSSTMPHMHGLLEGVTFLSPLEGPSRLLRRHTADKIFILLKESLQTVGTPKPSLVSILALILKDRTSKKILWLLLCLGTPEWGWEPLMRQTHGKTWC